MTEAGQDDTEWIEAHSAASLEGALVGSADGDGRGMPRRLRRSSSSSFRSSTSYRSSSTTVFISSGSRGPRNNRCGMYNEGACHSTLDCHWKPGESGGGYCVYQPSPATQAVAIVISVIFSVIFGGIFLFWCYAFARRTCEDSKEDDDTFEVTHVVNTTTTTTAMPMPMVMPMQPMASAHVAQPVAVASYSSAPPVAVAYSSGSL
mmetsp:Transcript_17300/g.44332  ORF Transcript_17300/g.44332 Transcript_17300/m.44332 type:complete len:205 (-) Transcript_17300:234-848(-)